MDSKIYSRALMIMIIVLISGFSFAADRNVPGTYATIQLAIDASDPGDNVIVAAGTYTENLTIDEEVTITGNDVSDTEIVGYHTVTADNVTITKFELSYTSSATILTLGPSGEAIDNFSLTYCYMDLTAVSPGIGIAIGPEAGSSNTITNVTIDHNTYVGPSTKISNPFKIGGSYAGGSSGIPISNVEFTNNTVSYGSIPINLKNDNINGILIDHNTFTNTDGLVYVWGDADPTGVLSNFVFTNNKADATNSYGVAIGDHTPTFDDDNFGVGNYINNNSLVGIPGKYGYRTVSLVGPTTYSLPANCNWWGTTVTSEIDAKVSGNVTYTTYLTSGTEITPDPGVGFDPEASCCVTAPLYDVEVTPGTSWATHSESISSNGCVVYKANLTIGKEYTFKTGCGDGATAGFDTFIEVYDADGDWLAQNDDGCSDYRSTITWIATETSAYVKVRGYNSTQYGDYTLAYMYVEPTASTCKTPPDSDETLDMDGTPLAEDTWATTASITLASNDCHVFEVTGILTGKTYTFKTGCATGGLDLATADFDTWIEVYDATGASLLSNDDGCSDYTSKVDWAANYGTGQVTDIIYVKVRGYNSSKYGSFRMAYYWGDAAPTTCKTPTEYTTGAELDVSGLTQDVWATSVASPGVHTITSDGCHVFQVQKITSGREYTFKTGCDDGATASFDTWIELYDLNGNSLLSNDDGCSNYTSSITWTATYGTAQADDVVYIKVRGYNSSKYGTFRMAYAWVSAPTVTCQPVPPTTPDNTFDLTATGLAKNTWATEGPEIITSDACYVYKVEGVKSGQDYIFKTGCATTGEFGTDDATADFDTWIELYDASGISLASNDDGCSNYTSSLTWTATYGTQLATDIAYVKVRGYNSSKTGTFEMAYQWDDYVAPTIICETPPESDETLPAVTTSWATDAGTIASDACYVYEMTTVAGNIYTFKLGCDDTGDANDDGVTAAFDSFLELYNSTGDWIQSDDDGCEEYRSTITWTATGTTYYIKVRGYNTNNYGTYLAAYKYAAAPHCETPPANDLTLTAATTSFQTASDAPVTLASDECHVYEVAVDEDNVYTFKTGCSDGASAAFDTFLELYDASAVWLAEDDDGCSVPASGDYTSKIEWTATYTGNAYLKVRGYNSSNYGAFTVAYKYVAGGPDVITLGTGTDMAKSQIKVYPNPADQSFTVVSKAPVTFTRLAVSEFTGKLVKSWNLDQPATSLRIESTGFAPGIYILSIKTSDGWIRKKVSIVR